MYLNRIFTKTPFLIVYMSAFLSAILIPKFCFEDLNNIWICNVTTNNDNIDCKPLEVTTYSSTRIIHLKIKNINNERDLVLFEASERCNIKRLHIEANQIPPNRALRNLKTIESLIIQHSQDYSAGKLSNVADNLLYNLDKLQKLKIENFKINLWNKEIFQTCTTISEIDLKSLDIEVIDFQSFVNCKKLVTLTIRFNRIYRLVISSFNGLTDLIKLYLPSNEIEEIFTNGNSWEGMDHLKELDLSNNKIAELRSRLFFGLKVLEKLSLKNNNLKSISGDTFLGLRELAMLDLQNNPRLISLDLNILIPIKSTLTLLVIDVVKIQCIYDKHYLVEFRNGVKEAVQPITTCDPNKPVPVTKPLSKSVQKLASDDSRPPGTIQNHQLTLIITVTILSTVIFFLLFFLIYYCVISKSKMKKYKSSYTNSIARSRADNISHYMSEIPTSPGRSLQYSDDTYAQFISQTTTRNDNRRSKTSMCTV